MQQREERAALFALLLAKRTAWSKIVEEILDADSVRAVLEKTFRTRNMPCGTEDSPLERAIAKARALLDQCASHGVGVHAFWEDHYPAALREIHEMPPVVFTKGAVAHDRRAVAVVGPRRPSPRGRAIVSGVAEALVERNITVVSGLTAGVDTVAHTAVLRRGGRTVTVLGTGINHYRPRGSRKLQQETAERGMVLSPFLPDTPAARENLTLRTAVMSGYAAATIVVEAGEHSSARAQAHIALRHGRPVIFTQELLANQWAREHSERPGVYVASGIAELVEVVDSILAEATMTADEFIAALETSTFDW
ncbi:hypothetical protein JCM3263A_12010 [Thermobifida fusca]|jgi:DNA processing protein|uniref:DNA uptake Rossmann fold nucleotide-binding protein n=3 Tax=Thermobifida fusca TaxID=2021 RepID=A0A9P2TDB7_THEFU|nr:MULTISPECIES: DNA-processing protein DprA [Thermobifida]EOR72265.1 DNA uptake Rossmann fold nucleotide-binding protein [Thermobifida fusca TM51]MBO2529388.1 DNA-processing protein DprA [Thermobifida sp.]PPS96488.1 nucleotide-binding protein [Thermobifida fusca]PZN64508.1 MAG: DNA-processing protein DprA [Thermobifida fusca]QOS60273.1 DNA-protecting protein DprA [Thermobifida fusca]